MDYKEFCDKLRIPTEIDFDGWGSFKPKEYADWDGKPFRNNGVEVERMPADFKVPATRPGTIHDPHLDATTWEQLMPRRIWTNVHDGMRFTTVEWMDGTKTTVKCHLDAPQANEFSGFAAALAKKVYGSTTDAIFVMKKAYEKAEEPARRREELRKADKEHKQRQHQFRIMSREEEIKREMDRQRIEREAKRRLEAEVTEEGKNVERD